jgi:hypothetical protein
VFIIGVPDGVTANDIGHVNKVLSTNVRRVVRSLSFTLITSTNLLHDTHQATQPIYIGW